MPKKKKQALIGPKRKKGRRSSVNKQTTSQIAHVCPVNSELSSSLSLSQTSGDDFSASLGAETNQHEYLDDVGDPRNKDFDAPLHCLLNDSTEEGATLPKTARNIAIAYLFIKVYGAKEPSEWRGQHDIQKRLGKLLILLLLLVFCQF